MIVVSFTELFCQWRIIYFAGRSVFKATSMALNKALNAAGKNSPYLERMSAIEKKNLVEDSASDEDQVKWWMWLPGLIIVIVMACVVLGVQYVSVAISYAVAQVE